MFQETIESDISYENEFQIIHLQYLKEEDSNYSVIPCGELDRWLYKA